MVHTCWVLYGMAGLSPVDFMKAKQGSMCAYFKYRLLSADEMVGAGGGKTADPSSSFTTLVSKCAALSFCFCK